MKRLPLLFVFLTNIAFSQVFEGKITYHNTYKSKLANISDQQFTQMLGDVREYAIKNGDYRTSGNGTMLQWQVYINKENKLYTKTAMSQAIFWNDGAQNPDEVYKSEINKGVIAILGHTCDELILHCKSGVQRYYFSEKLKVDPKWFENHKFANLYEFTSKTGALPLKVIFETTQFTLESTATAIDPMTLDPSLFTLPPDALLQKSPF